MKKLLIFLLLWNSFLTAQELRIPQIRFAPPEYVCYHSASAMNIDGSLTEDSWTKASWTKASWTEDFVDIRGTVGNIPGFRTRTKMLWDETTLYIAAELQEQDISGTLKNHDDAVLLNNNFEIFIDPDGDTHVYCEIEINALNTVWDLLLLKPYRDIRKAALSSWDMKGLKTAVSINGTLNNSLDTDSSWIVEAALPWKAFKELTQVSLPPKDGDQWRANFSRVEWKPRVGDMNSPVQIRTNAKNRGEADYWVWAPQGIVNMHYPEMWGYIQFATDTAGSKTTDFKKKESEGAKWFLRQIYYKEKNYFSRNGNYTADLKALAIEAPHLPGYSSVPVIECTHDLFEAYIDSEDHLERVHIRFDGLVWISPVKGTE